MGVDKKVKKAGQQLTDSLKQNTDLSVEEIRRITSENQQQLQTIADEQKAQDDASINNLATAQQAAEQSGADMVLEMGNQLKEAQQEGEAQVEADNRAARWTSAAELAASIANMIGVGTFGAVNQQYKSYSQDWMKKADQDIREHRSRMDNLNERLRAQKAKLDALKLGNAQALEGLRMRANNNYNNMRVNIANAGMTGAAKAAEIESSGRQAAATTAYSVEKDAIGLGMQEQARKDANAARDAQIQLQYDLHGWTTDPKTGRRVAPATGVTATGRGSGGGSGSNILLSIPPTTAGEKGTRLTINSGSLIATINANVDLFKANDQKAIQRILRGTGSQDDKAKQLEQYIKTSPEILDLLKLSSLAVDEFDWGKSETKAGQTAETPSQRSQGSVGSAADLDKLIGG